MLVRLCAFCLAFALFAGTAKADPDSSTSNWPQPDDSPTPWTAASPVEQNYCHVKIGELRNLDGTAASASTYAVALRVDEDEPGDIKSGSLAFYVGNDYYAVPFHDIAVAGWAQSLNESTPIVFQFPTAVHIDAAYVASLGAPISTHCDVGNLWHENTAPSATPSAAPWKGMQYVSPDFDLARFVQIAQTLPRTPAIFVTQEPPPSCDTPNVLPIPNNLSYPTITRRMSGVYIVQVTLDSTGTIIWAKILGATVHQDEFEAAALQSAESSTFDPEVFRCNPVYGTYLFLVNFDAR